jgi:branched-chain amino acid transport system ATP-binding protein
LAGCSLTEGTIVRKRIDDIFSLFPILAQRKNKASRLLSGGERQMLAVSLVLMVRPKLILLDEPSFGLAPLIVANLFKVIRDINAEWGSSVILVEQNIKEAWKLISRVYVMKEGKFVFEGSMQDSERAMRAVWGI